MLIMKEGSQLNNQDSMESNFFFVFSYLMVSFRVVGSHVGAVFLLCRLAPPPVRVVCVGECAMWECRPENPQIRRSKDTKSHMS